MTSSSVTHSFSPSVHCLYMFVTSFVVQLICSKCWYFACFHQEITHVHLPHACEILVTDIPMNPWESLIVARTIFVVIHTG